MKKYILSIYLLSSLFSTSLYSQTTIAKQGFETSGDTWTPLTLSTPACTNGADIWDYRTFLNTISPSEGSSFWGIADLNGNCGGSGFETISLPNVDISAYSSVTFSFDYNVFEFDNGDDLKYELFYDNVSQGEVVVIDGSSNLSTGGWITETVAINSSVTNVSVVLSAKQNGGGDYGGFDNVKLEGISCTSPDLPTVTYSPISTCSDSTITLTINGNLNDATEWYIYSGSCGGTLEGATTTSTFQLAPNSTTTYYVRGEGGCVTPGNCGTVTVNVTPTDNASFSYANSLYCQNATDPTPTISGLSGGMFSATPSGLSLNPSTGAIDVSASSPNIYAITYTTNGSCPNSHIEYLTISGPTVGYDVIATCNSYTWIDGVTYTSSNFSATHLLTNSLGCDSIATLNLTIFNSDNVTDTQVACDSYTWIDGITYTSSNNTATHTLTNQNGCDSIVTLNLTINNSTTGVDTHIACGSFTWIDGITYTASNTTATHTLTNQNGCDSIVTLNLTITTTLTGTDTQTACDSYTWIDGITYTASNNTAMHTLTSVQGCDSIVTLNLTILNSSTGIDTQVACNSYTWIDGMTYTSSNNTATHTLTNSVGCDSVVTLNLTIHPSDNTIDTQSACNSFTWIDGITYTASNNTATHTLTNQNGCDSIVTLNLTIHQPNSGVDIQSACNSYTWIDGITYTASNSTATHTLTNIHGCDSVVTLNLTITTTLTGTDTQTACGSYTWIDGNTYTSSNNTATHTLTSSQGCDSIVTLDLTIFNADNVTDTQVACDSYTWIDGITYTTNNNTATHTLTNQNGCDSIVTLDLTILNTTYGTDNQTACSSYTWIDGVTYTTSNNTATHTLTNSVGCDSVVTLNLTLGMPNTGIDTQFACTDFTWIDGITYTSSNNTATFTLTNMSGCDSIVTLNLTINSATSSTESITICGGETYIIGNSAYHTSGTYTTTLTTIGGCDSVVTTNLTVGQEIDTYVERLNDVFTVNSTPGATYQWLDCENNFAPIAGATNTTYTANETGVYAVAITLGNCSDTSICNELPYIVDVHNPTNSTIKVYPNPAKDYVTIEFEKNDHVHLITITDLSGKIVLSEPVLNQTNTILPIEALNTGVYFIRVHAQSKLDIIQLIKQ